jgi:hypothetical protein
MRFEGRELPPWTEPVRAEDLVEGRIYFSVLFLDEALTIPTLEPWAYVGKDLEPDDSGILYFPDAESYLDGVRYGSCQPGDDAVFSTADDRELGVMHEFERALEDLLRCSLSREGIGARRNPGPAK